MGLCYYWEGKPFYLNLVVRLAIIKNIFTEEITQSTEKNHFLLPFRTIWILSWILFILFTLKFAFPLCYSLYWFDCFEGIWVWNYCYLLKFIFIDSFPFGVRGGRTTIGVNVYICLKFCVRSALENGLLSVKWRLDGNWVLFITLILLGVVGKGLSKLLPYCRCVLTPYSSNWSFLIGLDYSDFLYAGFGDKSTFR